MAHACSKTFLSLLNSLLIIFGIALMVLSFYVYNKYHSIQLIIGVIILAFFVIFIGLLGLIGSVKRSKCALSIYIILVGFITIILLTILILFCVKQQWLINNVINNYEQFISNPKLLEDEKNIKVARDFLVKLECCGFKETNKPKEIFNEIEFCNHMSQSKPLCDEKMKDNLHQNLVAIITIHAILTGLGALACIMAIHLTCATNNKTRHTTFQSRYR
ncbi:unnamed protein product [Adineta steineri]|uniref:Tetraspanin n=1 Tax=Adineta steineri TaxID=433720 RepID=A0A815D1E0_9BILA|nr:unnamed protein product [Adineta steineri]